MHGPSLGNISCVLAQCTAWIGFLAALGCSSESMQEDAGAQIGRKSQAETQPGVSYHHRFGMYCGESSEDNWSASLDGVFANCDGLSDKMVSTGAERGFYYNLKWTKPYMEDKWDQFQGETVDLLYFDGHSGSDDGPDYKVHFSMWNKRSLGNIYNEWSDALTSAMRWGDEGRGLSVLASYSCDTIVDDGFIIPRWQAALSGGLRMVLGVFNEGHSGSSVEGLGRAFATSLTTPGTSIRSAWLFTQNTEGTRPAVLTTGKDVADCDYRRLNMTWGNFITFPRLRDGEIGRFCWEYIN